MKRVLSFTAALLALLTFCSCGVEIVRGSAAPYARQSVKDLETDTSKTSGNGDTEDFYDDEDDESQDDRGPMDLTGMRETDRYDSTLQILFNFTSYSGRYLKTTGDFEVDEKGFRFVTVYDAANCCYAKIELYGEADYPEAGSKIVVEGTLGYYEDGDEEYPCLFISRLSEI